MIKDETWLKFLSHKKAIADVLGAVTEERAESYGNTVDSFKRIAAVWSAWITAKKGYPVNIDEVDVAEMLSIFKRLRAINSYNFDNGVDGCNYMEIAGALDSLRNDKQESKKDGFVTCVNLDPDKSSDTKSVRVRDSGIIKRLIVPFWFGQEASLSTLRILAEEYDVTLLELEEGETWDDYKDCIAELGTFVILPSWEDTDYRWSLEYGLTSKFVIMENYASLKDLFEKTYGPITN